MSWKHSIIYFKKGIVWLKMKQKWSCSSLLGRAMAPTVPRSPFHPILWGCAPEVLSTQQMRRCPLGCGTHSTVAVCHNWWRVTCTTPVSSPTLTRMLPPGDSRDTTPAITAGSTQYFWPTVCIMGWYLSRYGMSISASLSEARTPKANTGGKRWLGVTYAEMGAREERVWAVVGDWETHVWVWSS